MVLISHWRKSTIIMNTYECIVVDYKVIISACDLNIVCKMCTKIMKMYKRFILSSVCCYGNGWVRHEKAKNADSVDCEWVQANGFE